jgi:hypothetical protein
MEAVGRFETDSQPSQKDHLSPVSGTSQECNDCEDEQEVMSDLESLWQEFLSRTCVLK